MPNDNFKENDIQFDLNELASFCVLADWSVTEDVAELRSRLTELMNKANSLKLTNLAFVLGNMVVYVSEEKASDAEFKKIIEGAISSLVRFVASDGTLDEQAKCSILAGFDNELAVSESDINSFFETVKSSIDESEKSLLRLEAGEGGEEQVDSLFRVFHNLKGEAGMVANKSIHNIAHLTESVLEKVKNCRDFRIIKYDPLFEVVDFLKKVDRPALSSGVEAHFDGELELSDRLQALLASLDSNGDSVSEETKANDPVCDFVSEVPVVDLSEGEDFFYEFINESEDHINIAEDSLLELENDPDNEECINKIFRAFHTIKGTSSFLNLEDIRTLTHDTETMIDQVRKKERTLDSRIVDAVLESIDCSRKLLGLLKEQVSSGGVLGSPYLDITECIVRVRSIIHGKDEPQGDKPKLGEMMVDSGIVTERDVDDALEVQAEGQGEHKKIGEVLVDSGVATKEQVERCVASQKKVTTAEATIKIGVQKLDLLIDMVGELVIAGAQVAQHNVVTGSENPVLMNNVSLLEKTIRDIQDVSMGMRLVPIRPVFQKMQRLVRDLTRKADKDVSISVSGEDTEIDKNIIDSIGDPLMHMIRNSVDHGIEFPDEREAAGKPRQGTVQLNAYHKGGNIVVDITDDGRGLNKEKILTKAKGKGLVRDGEALSDARIFAMIFEPGFSTADKVTDISGRGVGMDVVKRNIESLRGKIEIKSEEGKGSTFSIKLPLTLAIIDGIIMRVDKERYIAPIFSIVEFIQIRQQDVTDVQGKGKMLSVHGNLYPILHLGDFFSGQNSLDDIEKYTGCLVDSEYGKVCMLVDELIGQQQVVIKSLGERLQEVEGIAGGTILGDGKIGLILDINSIVSQSNSK